MSPSRNEGGRNSPLDLARYTPPCDLEAEKAVLGGVLLHSNLFFSIIDILIDDDFYSPAHKAIFLACQNLTEAHKPLDMLTLADQLAKDGSLAEIGGPAYLAELGQSSISSSNAVFHAHIVKEKAVRRALIDASSAVIAAAMDETQDTPAILDEAEASVFAIAEKGTTKTMASSSVLVDRVFKQLEARAASNALVTGVPSGYYKFDEMTAGLQPSDLIIVAGRPSMGKTAFAMNLAQRAAGDYGVPVAVFSLEMSMEQLMQRMLCVKGRVDLSKLRLGRLEDRDWEGLYDAANSLKTSPIFVDDTAAITTMELRARCRRIKSEHGLGLVLVDYLQLMRASRRVDSREQEISEISRSLKALAKELKVPVVALSQLNRKVEERADKRPMMSDLRESGAIEQDADVIIFLYREAAYKKKEELTPEDNVAEIIIGKQRNGPTGMVKLRFFREFTAFENLSDLPGPSEGEYSY